MSTSDIYQRQASIALDLPGTVAVVGCGGVGSWVAWLLALAGVRELYLFDDDLIELSNLNRMPFTMQDVGTRKVEATKKLIKQYRPECSVYSCGNWTEDVAAGLKIQQKASFVIAATDTLASRQMAYAYAVKHGMYYMEVGAEGDFGSVTNTPPEFSTSQEAQVGYQHVPVWLGPSLAAALLVVNQVVHFMPLDDKVIRLGWGWADNGIQFYDSKRAGEQPPQLDDLHDEWHDLGGDNG